MQRFAFGALKKATRPSRIAITGADSYSGRYMKNLLQTDENITEIRNLSRSDLDFDGHSNQGAISTNTSNQNHALVKENLQIRLQDIDVLILTYWMRFGFDQDSCPALERIKTIVEAAKDANVKRIVYLSHTKPDINSNIGYIRAKAQAEEFIANNFDSYGFVRPCLLFGDTPRESIVANNTAYLMRKLPVMMFPGDINTVHFQPVHVRDLAQMAVNMALTDDNGFIDAVGPEKLTFKEFITAYQHALGLENRRLLISTGLPASAIYQLTKPINFMLNDLYVEEGDLKILEQDIACSALNSAEGKKYWGQREFTAWLAENGAEIGTEYVNSFQQYYQVPGRSAAKL